MKTLIDYFTSKDVQCTPSPSRKRVRSHECENFFTPSESQSRYSQTPSSLLQNEDETFSEFGTPASASSLTTSNNLASDTLSVRHTSSSNKLKSVALPPIFEVVSDTQQPKTKKRKIQTQLYLDFGQADFNKKTICPRCGMLYVHGLKDDKINHERVCRDYDEGVSFTGWKNERRVKSFSEKDEEYVVEIRSSDPRHHRDKVRQVKSIVDKEMGFVILQTKDDDDTSSLSLGDKTAFLYVRDKRIVGFCTAEIISRGFKLNDDGRRSKNENKAILGLHQIWCHSAHRKHGIASRLVDVAREKMVFGYNIPLRFIAFSSPTGDGIKFAKRYLGTNNPLVYVCEVSNL